jgi:hypothetical protein
MAWRWSDEDELTRLICASAGAGASMAAAPASTIEHRSVCSQIRFIMTSSVSGSADQNGAFSVVAVDEHE